MLGTPGDAPQQATEDQCVERGDRKPIGAAPETSRIECGSLTNPRSFSPIERRYLEFQPSTAGQLQISEQTQPPIGFVRLNCPPVNHVRHGTILRIEPTPPHADTSEALVQPAPGPPE